MSLNREGFWIGENERECTVCRSIFPINGRSMCNPCNTKRVKSSSPESKMLNRARGRAKAKGLSFNLELCDIEIPEECPVLGIDLVVRKGRPGAYFNSPSLDRIIPELGYIKGNIQVISQQANQMKYNANKEELLMFANWIMETYSNEDN